MIKIHDSLNLKRIMNYLGDSPFVITLFDEVTSTNTLLKDAIKNGAHSGTTFVANAQTAGKGRLSRKFYSPKGSGLYFSTYIKTSDIPPFFMTVIASLAVVNAIEETFGLDTKIKWVNDVYFNGKKCAGILCEAINCDQKIDGVIVGIGVNVSVPHGGFDDEIKGIATALFDKPGTDRRNVLLSSVLRHLNGYIEDFDSAKIVGEYREKSFIIGKEVMVSKLDNDSIATVIDIDDECRLVVKYEDESIEHLSTGEVRIICR